MPRNYLVFALAVLSLFSVAQFYGYSPFGPSAAASAFSSSGRSGGGYYGGSQHK